MESLINKVVIITLTYNSSCIIEDFITSVKKNGNIDIIFVDNNSLDNTVEIIKKCITSPTIIKLEYNSGTSHGWNIAIKEAIKRGKYYFWILSPDVNIYKNTLKKLLSFAVSKKEGIFGPVVLKSENPDIVESFGSSANNFTGKGKRYYAGKRLNSIRENYKEVDYVDGGSCMITGGVIDKIGFFDENFFMYGEEVDFCYRAKKAGFNIIAYANSKLLHRHIELNNNKFNPAYHYYYRYRNRVYRAKKHFGMLGYLFSFINVLIVISIQNFKYFKYREFKRIITNFIILFDILTFKMGHKKSIH